jgi:glycosyltransferase involved in cell wall biosynthesis
MAREAIRRGAEAEIYTTNADLKGTLDVPLRMPIETGGVNVTYFPVDASHYYKISLGLALALRSIIPTMDLVDIHSLYQFPSTAAAYYARRCGVPYIIRPHGSLDPYLFRRHRLRKKLYELGVERRNLAAAARIHFTSEEEMALACESGISFKPVVVPLGVDLDDTIVDTTGKGFRARWPEVSGCKTLLFFGRINFKKGFEILVPAFARLARERRDVHLMIAGPDSNGFQRQVREWVSREGVPDRVTFTGMIEGSEKALALAGTTMFVLPSYGENFGIAVVEAMAAGLPVIISKRVNIWREIVAAGAGLATEPDVDEFTAAIRRVLDAPDAASRMGEAGRDLYQRSFTWESAGAKLMELYAKVIRENPARKCAA